MPRRICPDVNDSRDTSRPIVPRLHKRLIRLGIWHEGMRNLDLGGGRYDLASLALAGVGVRNLVVDPSRGARHNARVWAEVRKRPVDTVTVANVLNVICSADDRQRVIEAAARAVREEGLVAFQIYEGDRSGAGCRTTDGWQENRLPVSYEAEIARWFDEVRREGDRFFLCRGPREAPVGEVPEDATIKDCPPKRRAFAGVPRGAFAEAVDAMSLGKRLATARYVHVSLYDRLPVVVRAGIDRAAALAGVPLSRVQLLKLGTLVDEVSLLRYPRFWRDPFPALERYWKVDLVSGRVRSAAFAQDGRQPILHRKETFLSPDHPRWDDYAALTRALEARGLLRDAAKIGKASVWAERLRDASVRVEGHRLVGVRRNPRPRSLERRSSTGPSPGLPGVVDWQIDVVDPRKPGRFVGFIKGSWAELDAFRVYLDTYGYRATTRYLAKARAGRYGFINLVMVSPDARGRGLGAELVREALAALWAEGADEVLLVSEAERGYREKLETFYERLGFTRVGREFGNPLMAMRRLRRNPANKRAQKAKQTFDHRRALKEHTRALKRPGLQYGADYGYHSALAYLWHTPVYQAATAGETPPTTTEVRRQFQNAAEQAVVAAAERREQAIAQRNRARDYAEEAEAVALVIGELRRGEHGFPKGSEVPRSTNHASAVRKHRQRSVASKAKGDSRAWRYHISLQQWHETALEAQKLRRPLETRELLKRAGQTYAQLRMWARAELHRAEATEAQAAEHEDRGRGIQKALGELWLGKHGHPSPEQTLQGTRWEDVDFDIAAGDHA